MPSPAVIPAKGQLEAPFFLVALPQLQDENFMRTVVLVTEYTSQGAFGLILNKALVDEEEGPALMRAEVKDAEGNTLFEFNEDLFEGGPVSDESIFVLHEIADLEDSEAVGTSGLFLSADPNSFQKLLEHEEYRSRRRFYLGSSQWTAGQLDSELRTGTWIPLPLDKRFVFDPVPEKDKGAWRDDLWKRVLMASGANPFTLMGQGAMDAGSN